jgi:predicted AAA+ superfamily ATPase
LDRGVRESLAGRASYFFLHSLSVAELGPSASLTDWLFRGGWPELHVRKDFSPTRYLGDYVRTFVEKDIAAMAGVERLHEFHRTLSLLAARTGTLLNATDIGQLAGVKGQTVAGWLDLLERNALALRLTPYHSNLNKRLVRTPKIYILDTGLAAYLQGWQAAEPMLASPQAGPLFETLALGELVRARDHLGLRLDLHFWRTKEGEEIDFLVQGHGRAGPRWFAIEAKLGVQNVQAIAVPRTLGRELPDLHETWVVTPGGDSTRLSKESLQVPISQLAARLKDALDNG